MKKMKRKYKNLFVSFGTLLVIASPLIVVSCGKKPSTKPADGILDGIVTSKNYNKYSSYDVKTKTLTINEGVTKIENGALNQYISEFKIGGIQNLVLPSSLTDITGDSSATPKPENTPFGMFDFLSITFGKNVTKIGNCAFYKSEIKGQSLVLPQTLKTIGDQAFYTIGFSHGITIPASVTSIGKQAFWNFNTATSGTIVFEGDALTTKLTLGDGSFSAVRDSDYIKGTDWQNWAKNRFPKAFDFPKSFDFS